MKFTTLAVQAMGMPAMLGFAVAYALLATALTEWLLQRNLRVPAGLSAAFAIAMAPMVVFVAQHLMGQWPEVGHGTENYRDFHYLIDWRWIVMELATLIAGVAALARWRLPFLVMPIAVTLWYLGMDIAPLLLQEERLSFGTSGRVLSMCFGLATMAVALAVDLRNRSRLDYAFWLHLSGGLTFWAALSSLGEGRVTGAIGYGLIGLALVAWGAMLRRRVYAVLGGFSVAGSLGCLSYRVFEDSLMFPIALTIIGAALVGAGIWWQRHQAALCASMARVLPAAWVAMQQRG